MVIRLSIMRKIRGIVADGYYQGQWIIGDYYTRQLDENYKSIRDYIIKDGKPYKVVSDTVNLSTGILDINGKDIFDEDIVRYISKELNGETYGVVRFKNKNYLDSYYVEFFKYDGNVVRGDKRYNRTLRESTSDYSFEVIGNTYENSGMLYSYTRTYNPVRIIKFKAKHKTFDEWYYGNYYYIYADDNTMVHYISSPLGKMQINPNTLCQYTEFDDLKGKEIYANDVIRFNDKGLIGIVYYDHTSGSYRIIYDTPIPKGSTLASALGNSADYEVISNYYDRPELQRAYNLENEDELFITNDYY